MPFHLLGFHTFPRVMTSCSDVVPSASRQRPGISSSGLWERSKPFNYSRENDSFENTPSPFPSACAFVRQSLLYTDTRSKDVKCHCQTCCRRVAAVSGRVLPCLTPRLGALGSRLPGPRRIVRVFPICSCAKFISLIYAAAGSSSDAPAWLSTGAKKKKEKKAHVEIVPPVHVRKSGIVKRSSISAANVASQTGVSEAISRKFIWGNKASFNQT